MKSGSSRANALVAEHDDRLRDVEIDDLQRAGRPRLRHRRQVRPAGRQIPEKVVKKRPEFGGGDVAHDRHHQPVAHERRAVRRADRLHVERRDQFGRSGVRPGIGVIGERLGVKRP